MQILINICVMRFKCIFFQKQKIIHYWESVCGEPNNNENQDELSNISLMQINKRLFEKMIEQIVKECKTDIKNVYKLSTYIYAVEKSRKDLQYLLKD